MRSATGDIDVPTIAFGTWAFGDNGWYYEATLGALKARFKHIDCAWNYSVDEEVGQPIRDSGVARSELFISSKFWPQFGASENLEKCLDLCLRNMETNYLDLVFGSLALGSWSYVEHLYCESIPRFPRCPRYEESNRH